MPRPSRAVAAAVDDRRGCFRPSIPDAPGYAAHWRSARPSRRTGRSEKSSRSLMLTEVAVACSATPISSAMAMNRLLKISSRTGSASVPAASARSSGAARVRISVPSLARRPLQPGSMTMVEAVVEDQRGAVQTPPPRCARSPASAEQARRVHRLSPRRPAPRPPASPRARHSRSAGGGARWKVSPHAARRRRARSS